MSGIVAPGTREVRSPRGFVTLRIQDDNGHIEGEGLPESLPLCPMPGKHRCPPAIDDYGRHLAYIVENPAGDWLYIFNLGQHGWDRAFAQCLGCDGLEIRFSAQPGTPELSIVTKRGQCQATLFHEWTLGWPKAG